jgi:hypothetical protein
MVSEVFAAGVATLARKRARRGAAASVLSPKSC